MVTLNLLTGGCVLGYNVHYILNGGSYTRVYFNYLGFYDFILKFFYCFLYQTIIEYYWHRMMHLPFFYKNFHKLHHYVKSPQPFEDLFQHPLETFIYYVWTFGVGFFISMHI